MNRPVVLFVNHHQLNCGVYQMGYRIGRALLHAARAEEIPYIVHWVEANDPSLARGFLKNVPTAAAIYNWHPTTLPWARDLIREFPQVTPIGLIHEIAPDNAFAGVNLFPYRIACDPTLPANGETLFRAVRPLSECRPAEVPLNKRFVVGSFGFAVGGKRFPEVVRAAGEAFPGCLVRLLIPFARYGDERGKQALSIARECFEVQQALGNGTDLSVSHELLDEQGLVDYLAANDLNVFFYDANPKRGCASVLDHAVAAGRPIAVNGSRQFRHAHPYLGKYPDWWLLHAWEQNGEAVRRMQEDWSRENLVRDFAAMLQKVVPC